MIFSPCFRIGIDLYLKEAGINASEISDQFEDLVVQSVEDAIWEKAQMDATLGKKSAVRDLSPLERYIEKRAEELEKSAVIRQQSCTDSDGNSGSWVLMNSSGSKILGCHGSREGALKQERAIQAHKHAEEKMADMESGGSPKGREGRAALAKRFKKGEGFDMSACISAMTGEDGIDDPASFCQSLKSLALG